LPSLDLGNRKIDYSVVRGRSSSTYFRFKPDLTLEVIIPKRGTPDVDRLLRSKLGMVRREFFRASRNRRILTQDSMMLDGVVFDLEFMPGTSDRLTVDHEGRIVVVESHDRRSVRELVRRLYLKESSAYVVRRTAELARAVGVRPSRVDVREIGKWGYCTRGGRLSFSWQMAALPERVRDYVIYHELVHLIHFDHSSAFKKSLKAVCPDFRDRERELDTYVPYNRLDPPG